MVVLGNHVFQFKLGFYEPMESKTASCFVDECNMLSLSTYCLPSPRTKRKRKTLVYRSEKLR